MPQEGRRSIGYRPFITCDDPRGVVECGSTIRKQKSDSLRRKQKNLNHGVSSWSPCGHIKNNEKYIAKDLLKGALDLEESLAMLSKLQHSSDHISGSANKQLNKGALRDELQEMRSHGVDGKNVFLDPFSEEACCDDDRRLDSSDAPSTSSSQSSSNFVSPESFLSSTASQKRKKPRGSNLIAKLMGIEYGRKKDLGDDGEKIVNQKKPAFDLDSPRGHDSGWKRRTLDQMIEALKFKGNSKTSQLNGVKSSPHSHRDYWSSIVIMKPSKFSCLNLENPIIPKPRSEVDEEMLLKMRIRSNPLAESDEFENLNCNEKEMVDRTKGKASSPGKSRPHKKHLLENNAEEAQKASGSRRKGERKKTPNSESQLQSLDGGKLAMSSSNSEKNWPKSDEEVTDKDVTIANGNERFREVCEGESLFLLEDSTRLAEDASQIEITDYVDNDQSSSNETPLSSCSRSNTQEQECQCSTTTLDIEEEENCGCVTSTPSIDYSGSRKGSTGENKLKELLLSCPPFINRVEELFDLKGNSDKVFLQNIGTDIDHNDLNARMLLDTANELVELHGYECSRACPPLPLTYKMSSVACYYTSLDQLLDEVCEGIEAFGCYIKDVGESHSTDNLLLLVKEDLRSRRMIDGVWDIGWRNVGSADEIEEITRGVDQFVLDGLIEEILVDLTV